MIALDCEFQGLDYFHSGGRPFFITLVENGDQTFWEWQVNPLTRQPVIPPEDRLRIRTRILGEKLLWHNGTADANALVAGGIITFEEALELLRNGHDTLISSHILGSNHKHDLTSQAFDYLDYPIYSYEEALGKACAQARRMCQSVKNEARLGKWRIAKEGLPDMPSVKGGGKGDKNKKWKNDMWLPLAIAEEFSYPEDHEFRHVLANYSNQDTAVLPPLEEIHQRLLKDRGLEAVYKERMKLPAIAFEMHHRGITVHKPSLYQLRTKFKIEAEEAAEKCLYIAGEFGYDLDLPKGKVNNSLKDFIFDVLKLDKVYNPKAKSDSPTLDAKNAMPHYTATLQKGTPGYEFINALQERQSFSTAISYLDSYERYWLPHEAGEEWRIIHPSVNPTGSDTLRWSHSNPNMANISKKEAECRHCEGEGCERCGNTGTGKDSLRKCFRPEPHREWWSFDAKNIELRIPAYECGEQDLIDLFERMDEPPYYGSEHLLNFSAVYPDIWEKELKEVGLDKVGPHIKEKYKATWYQWCKNGDFAVGYGAVDRDDVVGTADQAFHKVGAHKLLKQRFAKKEKLNRHWIAYANKHGYVETIPDKEVCSTRGYPILCTRSQWGKIKETVPLNYHIQSTAMWWTCRAMVKVTELLHAWNREKRGLYFITAQIHDEILVSMPRRCDPRKNSKASNLWRAKEIQRVMESCGDGISVPTPVGMEYHPESYAVGIAV